MEQHLQLPPQELLPFFLSFIRLLTARHTTPTSPADITMVPIFCDKNSSIISVLSLNISRGPCLSPRENMSQLNSYFLCKCCSFFVLLKEQHVDDSDKEEDCKDKSDYIQVAGECAAELCNHKCDYISETTLI